MAEKEQIFVFSSVIFYPLTYTKYRDIYPWNYQNS